MSGRVVNLGRDADYFDGFSAALSMVEELMMERLRKLQRSRERLKAPKTRKQGLKWQKEHDELMAKTNELTVLASMIKRELEGISKNGARPKDQEIESESTSTETN
jgi:alkylation response protein AidB-like acyl-CoA dehydrogenase